MESQIMLNLAACVLAGLVLICWEASALPSSFPESMHMMMFENTEAKMQG